MITFGLKCSGNVWAETKPLSKKIFFKETSFTCAVYLKATTVAMKCMHHIFITYSQCKIDTLIQNIDANCSLHMQISVDLSCDNASVSIIFYPLWRN